MSRLIEITPEIEQEPEPPGQEFGYDIFETLEPIETTTHYINELKEEIQIKHEAIPDDLLPIVDLTESQLEDIQMKDKFIKILLIDWWQNNNLKGNLTIWKEDYSRNIYMTINKDLK